MKRGNARAVGIVVGIALHRKRREMMEERDSVCVTIGSGIEGDVLGVGGRNQE